MDLDGDRDVVAGGGEALFIYENNGRADGWQRWGNLDASGQIDDDGDFDLAYSNGWYEGPTDPTGTWIWHQVTDQYGISNTLARDMDGDLDLDLLMGAGHHGDGVYWFEQPANPSTPNWTGRQLFTEAVQNLACVDIDRNGRIDVVGSQGFVHPGGEIFWAKSPPDPRNDLWTEHPIAGDLDGPENVWAGDLDGDGGVDFVADGNAEDHIYLWRQSGPANLFTDDFESGDTSGWSLAVP